MRRLLAFSFVPLALLLSACGDPQSADNVHSIPDQAPSSSQTQSPTNVYRLLTAVRNNQPFSASNEELASACERHLGFSREMTAARVISAREINIPIQTSEEFTETVPIIKPRTVRTRPESSGEIVYEEHEQVVIEESGYQEKISTRIFDGMCIGSEYITE
jgi:hypothetical protein